MHTNPESDVLLVTLLGTLFFFTPVVKKERAHGKTVVKKENRTL